MKKCKKKIIVSILMIFGVLGMVHLNGQDLRQHRWEERVLIVKSTNEDNKMYQAQLKEFENAAKELADRKLILYKITGDYFQLVNFENKESIVKTKLSPKFAKKILRKKETFEVILIGLDGGIKLRQTKLLSKEALYQTIDVMPMRRQELQERDNKN